MAEQDVTIVEIDDESSLPTCLEVLRRSFRTVADELGLTAESVPSNAAFWDLDRLRAAQAAGARLFALLVDGTPLGCVSLRATRHEGVVSLERLAVLPEHRHRGFGAALLEHGIAVARAEGAAAVRIGIIAENDVLRRWYREKGFVTTETRTFPYLPFTVEFMRRDLDGAPGTPDAAP